MKCWFTTLVSVISFSSPYDSEIFVIPVTILEVKIILEIYIRDIATFYHLLPGEFCQAKNLEVPPLKDRMKVFSQKGFQVVTEKGQRLVPYLFKSEPRQRIDRACPFAGKINPVTKLRIPGPPIEK